MSKEPQNTRYVIQELSPLDELFNCRLELGSTILGMKTFSDDEVDLSVASCPSLLESTVRVSDSFLNI
jgi:hypothetical protein